MTGLKTDSEKNEPLYMRLAADIRSDIQEGRLATGQRMPTVKEMCAKTNLSAGTVRQAYGLLQAEGLIELAPGRGTYVSVPKAGGKSRKAQALEAIDRLFQSMSEIGFSEAEARMLLTLRLAQKDAEARLIQTAAVAESGEELRRLFDSLSEIPDLDVIAFTKEDLQRAGNVALSDFPLVISTNALSGALAALLNRKSAALCPVAFSVTPETILSFSRIPAGEKVVLYAETETYLIYMRKWIRNHLPSMRCASVIRGKLNEEALTDAFAVICAPDLAAFAPDDELRLLRNFSKFEKPVIAFEIELDEGSVIAIQNRIRRIQKQ